MNYQQTGRIAIAKKIAGWVLFIPAVISTVVSVLNFLFIHSDKQPGIDAVLSDFLHVMIDMIKFNTHFLDMFWNNSPTPEFHTQANVMFWIIYAVIFIGLALQASGARMWRQSRFLKENIEDQLIIEQAKETGGLTRQQLTDRFQAHNHSIFRQYFPLYVLPVIIIVIGYFILRITGLLYV